MKYFLILIMTIGSVKGAAVLCFQGADAPAKATKCSNSEEKKCKQPTFTEYQGFAQGIQYACGKCAEGQQKTCTECTSSSEKACNTKVTLGADFKCYSYQFDTKTSKWVEKTDKATCKRSTGKAIICNKPTSTATQTSYSNTNGCGPCEGETKGKGCEQCDTDSCNKTPIKCVQGTDGSAAATVCKDAQATATKCSKPKFIEYTGFSPGVSYACGACAGNTKDSTCEECDGKTDDGCNKPIATGTDFKCFSYEFSTSTSKFSQKTDKTTCKIKKGTPTVCNRPLSSSTKTTYTNTNGCGPCAGATKDKGCKQCDTDSCNKMPIKCVQGADGSAAATECDVTATKCSMPKFIEYTGFSAGVSYKCGACAGGTKDSTCEECDGKTDDGCNKRIATSTFKCFSYEFKSDKFVKKTDKTTCNIKSGSPILCNRPIASATTTTYTNKDGCGKCAGETKGCKQCNTDSCNEIPIKCVQGADGNAAATECTDVKATKCSKPKFIDYTGFSAGNYACGACAGDTKDKTCEECDGNQKDGCNKPITTGDDYKCLSYEFKNDKFVKKTDKTTCKIKSGSPVLCNRPIVSASKTTYTNKNGCGPCAGTTKDKECKQCDKDSCNEIPIKCVQGTDASAAATECKDAAATKCLKPKFIDYTGFSKGVSYACGACAADTKDKTCEECAGTTGDGCNKAIKTEDFKCYTYPFNTTSKKYSQENTTCKRLPTSSVICNMPATKETGTDKYTNANGCGACAGDTKNKTCQECTKALCNKLDVSGAAHLHTTCLFVHLLALIYIIL